MTPIHGIAMRLFRHAYDASRAKRTLQDGVMSLFFSVGIYVHVWAVCCFSHVRVLTSMIRVRGNVSTVTS